MNDQNSTRIDLYTTCPPYQGQSSKDYVEQVRRIARWSDDAGCKGILVYTDNSLPDPWLVSQIVLQDTTSLEPLVAVQPIYMHPYTVAKMVSSLSVLYGQRICLNMVAGGFAKDLEALADSTPHDRRYERLIEYTRVIQHLLSGPAAVSFEGQFYQTKQLALKPSLPKELYPTITISGSSPAGFAAARALGAVAVQYPEPVNPTSWQSNGRLTDGRPQTGIRVGILAREEEVEAWRVAEERFPADRAGEIAHNLAMKASDSQWHRTLSAAADTLDGERSTYWLRPFRHYKTFCPYLVGSYDQVSDLIAAYLSEGHTTFILDVPASREELVHTAVVFTHAQEKLLTHEDASRSCA